MGRAADAARGKPRAALAIPATVENALGGLPRAAFVIPAPGERTISNAEVPLPRSPLSLAAGTANRKAVLTVVRQTGDAEGKPPAGYRGGRASR